jgi:hypothetical protein
MVQLEGLGKLKKKSTSSGIDLPVCSIVHQPTMLKRAPTCSVGGTENTSKFYTSEIIKTKS